MSKKSIIYTGLLAMLGLSVIAVLQDNWKIVGISWIAFGAMALAIPLGYRAAAKKSLNHLVAGYGLASGAMITSAAIFLVPEAVEYDPIFGGLGIALGIISGFAIHTLNHRLTHSALPTDPVVIELTAHCIADGVIVGLLYTAMPKLSLLLGLGIISHKGPAGYASARRLRLQGRSAMLILVPSLATGLAALPLSFVTIPANPFVNALIFGFATGVFFHVAIDFLPECEVGGTIYQVTDLSNTEHHKLDKYRRWAVYYTFAGGGIIFLLWLAVYATV